MKFIIFLDSIRKLPNVATSKINIKKGGLLNLDSTMLNEMLTSGKVKCTKQMDKQNSMDNLILKTNINGKDEFILHNLEQFEKNVSYGVITRIQ